MTRLVHRAVSVFALAAGIALVAGASAEASQYMPNRQGDIYRYKNNRYQNEQTSSVTQTSGGWRYWTQFSGLGPRWIWTATGSETVYIWNGTNYEVFCNFSAAAGASFRINIGCNIGNVTIRSKGRTVTVPAGTFTDCVILDLQTACADAGVTSAVFARGIGPIQFFSDNIAGSVTDDLIGGTINGVAYPQATTALEVSGTIDGYQVTINRMPSIGGPRPPKVVNAYIKVTNRTGADIAYMTGRPFFDVEVQNSGGTIVSTWSRGRLFTRDLVQLTLRNGETVTYGGPVELTDGNGAHLAPGLYKVVVRLSSDLTGCQVSFPIVVTHAF